jgi:hypothetical protein
MDRLMIGVLLGGVVLSGLLFLVALGTGYIYPADLHDEVWPQHQEAPVCAPPGAPTGGHAYG